MEGFGRVGGGGGGGVLLLWLAVAKDVKGSE